MLEQKKTQPLQNLVLKAFGSWNRRKVYWYLFKVYSSCSRMLFKFSSREVKTKQSLRTVAETELKGKTIVITGASGYLGRTLALGLAEAGARLVLLGRSRTRIHDAYNQAWLNTQKPTVLETENYDQSTLSHLFKDLCDSSGVPDIIVNCLGQAEDKPLMFHQTKDARESLQANVFPVMAACEAVLPFFLQRGHGNIINIVSITGQVGQPMRSLYGAAKGAVIAYSKALARRHAAKGVRVNCVAPQVVTGGLADKMSPKIKRLLQATTPIPRDCVAEDLLSPVMMLAKEQQGFITGEVVNVTGGLITW